ncbi:MAG TPA: NAD(P)/FAD-dependent oxidoreductase [Casimicrobiaceae bacterium]|nr:NAD(P)/FAD-dependent oxidoreductase [Casimicrobiaceae bacterium]
MRLVQTLAARTRAGPRNEAEAAQRAARRRTAAREVEIREQRREWLRRGVAMATVASVAPGSLTQAATRSRGRVVVVGGGLAGLTAAFRLAQQGVDVALFEAAPRVGGRCWTERRAFDGGQIAERGGELIDTAHDDIIDLALELGLVLDDLHAATPKGTESVFWIAGRRYSEGEAARDLAQLWPALGRDSRRLGEALPTFAKFTREQATLDRMSAREWLSSRVPGGLASPLARLLANAYTEELGADIDDISAVTVIDLLRDSPRDRLSPYEESDQRYHLRGGNDSIVARLAESLGARIETGTRLVALAKRGDGRYRLTLARDSARRDIDADRVVLAIPFPLLADVDLVNAGFRERKLRAIRELGMGRNTKLQLQFNERVWNAQRGNGETRVEGSYQVSWDVSRAQAGAMGILNFYSGGTTAAKAGDGTPEARASDALADLDKLYPGIASRFNGRVIRNAWDRNPWSRGSYSLIKPGQYTTIHGIAPLPEGRVHFAGEQSSLDWYGYMNGAVESGTRAATEIARTLSRAA